MSYKEILNELQVFPDREKNLRGVVRYVLYHIMFYRTNLWTHSRRVPWLVETLALCAQAAFGDEFDSLKAVALAFVHDDAETIFGDVQAGNKEKMTPEQLAEVKQKEYDAIVQLVSISPKTVAGYNYHELLLEAINKTSLESIVVNWADKFDAFGEALHEIFAGNTLWTINVVNEYGTITLPTDYYMNYFQNFTKKFPRAVELFKQPNSPFKIPDYPNVKNLVQNRIPHTRESLTKETGYFPYDFWVQTTLRNGTEEDIMDLYTKKE